MNCRRLFASNTYPFTNVMSAVQVWIALEEKGIPFDTVLIDLFKKPEWYPEVAANGQTPSVRLDGENICESWDILMVRAPTLLLN